MILKAYHSLNRDVNFILYLYRNIERKKYIKKIKTDIGKILREWSKRKGVPIRVAEWCKDYLHM